jgi:hypothetical protein
MRHGALILKTFEHVIAGKLASTMASERCQWARNCRREGRWQTASVRQRVGATEHARPWSMASFGFDFAQFRLKMQG